MRHALWPLAAVTLLAACGGAPNRRDPALRSQAPRARPAAPAPAREPPDDDLQRSHRSRPALDVVRGRASYYSDRLAGNRTASGDIYDPRALTAASRDLPFGTILRVVREDTGATVVVRINDRGPFGNRSRILDVSRAAAEALGMIRAGVVDVRAEVLERPSSRR